MPQATIDRLIINSPYQEPERQTRWCDLVDGHRLAPQRSDQELTQWKNQKRAGHCN